MTTFAELLKNYLSKKRVSINELARYTGIDHSTLYKITKGNRNPSSIDIVNRIAYYLRLTDAERLALREAYYQTVLGEQKYFGFKQITELLGNLRSTQTFNLHPYYSSENVLIDQNRILSGMAEITDAIISLCQESASRKEKISILTIGSFSLYAYLISQILHLYPGSEINHLMVMDESYNLNSEYHLYNLECISYIVPLLIQHPNYHPQCIYADINTLRSISPLISEMVITETSVCIFRQDGKNGFVFSDMETRNVYYDIFHELALTSHKFANHLTPDQLINVLKKCTTLSDNNMNSLITDKGTYLFNPGICSVLVLNPDDSLISEHLKIRDPQKNLFIQALNNYLPIQRARLKELLPNCPLISTRQGLEYFVNTGYINEVHPNIMYPLNITERISILKKWQVAYNEHSFILVNLPYLNPDSHFWVMTSSQNILLQISTVTGDYLNCQITEPSTVSLFNDYFSFLIKEYQIAENDVQLLINECINKLEIQKR